MQKKWIVAQPISAELKNQFPEINPVILQLLYNRHLTTQQQIDEFLLPDYSRDIYDPYLFTQMSKAVERINKAIEQQENILIYSDYDVDGITSAVVLRSGLEKLGAKNISVYLPDREKEGYGMRPESVQEAAKNQVKLIITCDLGITALSEVELANQLGIDVIVTDHHLPLEKLPPAYAILDPQEDKNYPCKYLAGVGMAFKLVQALLQDRAKRQPDFHFEAFEKWLLDLVALGTVADMMILLGENRTIVKYGLIVLNKTNRLGLKVLCEESKLVMGTIDTRTIYYQLGPRLNVASRLDHANTALALILSQNRAEAQKISQDLNHINSERQKMVDGAFQKLKAEFGPDPKERIMIGYSPDWPVGILGLISGKLREEYQRPALAVTKQGDGLVGSGRSNDQLSLVDLFVKLAPILSRYGGHRRAAGFAMDDVNKLKDFIAAAETAAQELMDKEILPDELLIEAEISVGDVTWNLQENLEQFAPFGEGNPTPLFLMKNLTIDNFQWLGQNDKHLKLVANGRKFIHFCADDECKGLRAGSKIDVVVEVGVNQWNGTKELQLKIVALKIL